MPFKNQKSHWHKRKRKREKWNHKTEQAKKERDRKLTHKKKWFYRNTNLTVNYISSSILVSPSFSRYIQWERENNLSLSLGSLWSDSLSFLLVFHDGFCMVFTFFSLPCGFLKKKLKIMGSLLHGTLFSFSFFLFLHHFGIWVSLLLITCFCCVLFWFFFFFEGGYYNSVLLCMGWIWSGVLIRWMSFYNSCQNVCKI